MRETRPLKPSVLDKLVSGLARTKGDGSRDLAPCYIATIDRFNEAELRNCVMRDLGWILNDINFAAAIPLDEFPEVRSSVLNQGVPDLATLTVNRDTFERRSREMAEAVRQFEPRLIPETLVVAFESTSVDAENKLRFIIQGELKSAIDDRFIEFKTSVALDTGDVQVVQ